MAIHEDPALFEKLGEASLLALQRYAEDQPAAFLEVVSEMFDILDEQEAVHARPIEITKLIMKDGHLVARAQLQIVYKNPLEPGDRDLAAENITRDDFDIGFVERGADLTVEGITPALGETFPTSQIAEP